MPEQQPSTVPNSKNSAPAKQLPKQENIFLNLGCNLILPIMVLKQGEKWFGSLLEPYFERVAVGILLIAIAFPIGYFVFDLIKRSKFNFVSIVGLISVLLTGLFGVLELPVKWFALKEAALPLAVGIGIAASIYTKNSFFKAIVLNPDICNVDRITTALQKAQKEVQFEKLLRFCNWVIVVSMGLSVVLNFVLARTIVISPTGTEAFNDEVAKMMWVSMIVIMVPSMALMIYALWRLMSGIQEMTGLKLEDIMHAAEPKKES